MAVSVNRGSFFVGVLMTRALLLGVYTGAPDFLETPIWSSIHNIDSSLLIPGPLGPCQVPK